MICFLLLSSLFSVVHAQPVTQARKWNIGIQFNNLNPIQILKKCKNLCFSNYQNHIQKVITANPSAFIKYQHHPYFNYELKSIIIKDFVKNVKSRALDTYSSHLEYVTNLMYPFKKNINLYARAGARLTAHVNKMKFMNIFIWQNYKNISPVFSVGMNYLLNNYLNLNMNINLKKYLNNLQVNNGRSLLNIFNIGVSWQLNPHNNLVNTTPKLDKMNIIKKKNNIYKPYHLEKKKYISYKHNETMI